MITTRFIFGVPLAAAITFGLFVLMRSLIAGDGSVPEEVYIEPVVIVIGRTVPDSPTRPDEPVIDKPETEVELEEQDPVVIDNGELGEDGDGLGSLGERIPIELGGGICGQPTVRIAPTYPRRALEQGVEGYAIVQFTVTVEGTVRDAVVVDQEPGNYFGTAARKAVEKWRYAPCTVNGKVQEVRLEVQLVFELGDSE